MKKIVFVLGNYKNGGMAARATTLANEFAKRGYPVNIVATGAISGDSFVQTQTGVRIVSLDDYFRERTGDDGRSKEIRRLKRMRYFTKHLSVVDEKLARRISFLRAGQKLRHYFADNPPSVAIALGTSYIKPVLSATEGLGCKVIYAEKNAPEQECPKDTPGFLDQIALLKSTDAVIVQTNDAKKYYAEYLDRVYVVNNPVKADLPEPYTGQRSKRIVNFCRISKQKNLELLMDAFLMLHQDHPDYTVDIYGNIVYESEQQYKDVLIQRVQKLGLNDCFRLHPPAADVHRRILDAAMFVSSSDYEGLSNSMIEAMAIGLPCICTDCLGGGVREVMTDHENGLVVPMKDAYALYRAMKEFVEDPQLAERCGKEAAAVRQKLDAGRIASKWLEIIKEA